MDDSRDLLLDDRSDLLFYDLGDDNRLRSWLSRCWCSRWLVLVSFDRPRTTLLDQRVDVCIGGFGGCPVAECRDPGLSRAGSRGGSVDADGTPGQLPELDVLRPLGGQSLILLDQLTVVGRGRVQVDR